MAKYLSLEQASENFPLKVDALKAAISRGQLRAKKTGENGGGKFVISEKDLDKFFETLEDA